MTFGQAIMFWLANALVPLAIGAGLAAIAVIVWVGLSLAVRFERFVKRLGGAR